MINSITKRIGSIKFSCVSPDEIRRMSAVKIITADTKKAMKKILSDIQDGTFAKDFLLDMSSAGAQVHFNAMRKLASEHPSEIVGQEIRKLYSWSDEDKLINN